MPPTADTAVASAGALPRHIRWFVASNALSGIFTMLTFSSSVFVLYLADLGLDKARIGFMLALFPFCGLVAPFISGWVSRFGLKATLLLFYGVRNFVMLFMLAAPWVLVRFGLHALFVYAGSVIFVFAMCRAVAETGFYPWSQEFVPDSVRGRVGGITNVVTGYGHRAVSDPDCGGLRVRRAVGRGHVPGAGRKARARGFHAGALE